MSFIYSRHPRLNEDNLQVFKLFWTHSILDVIAVSICGEKISIFTYNPFGEFKLVNLSNSSGQSYYNIIDDIIHPLNINVIISIDIPNIFVKGQTKNVKSSSEIRLGGPDGRMCELFCENLNINCHVLQKPYDRKKFNLTLDEVALNTSPIIYEAGENNVMTTYTYPLYFDAVVVIIQASKPLSKLMRMTFSMEFGNSREALAIILASAILMLCMLRFRRFSFFTFYEICSDILSVTFTVDLRRLFNFKLRETLVILPTIIFGFYIINTCIFILTTFYTTTTYYRPDIDSLRDIDQLKCKFAVSSEHSMKMISDFNDYNWTDRFVFLDQSAIGQQLFRFDINTCCIDSSRRADILMRYQKRCRRNLHVIEPNLVPQLHSYMIHPKSPLKHRFDELILNAMSSGLYFKWSSDIYIELYEENILKYFAMNSKLKGTSSLEILYIFWPLTILFYGYFLSFLIFCGEVFKNYYRH